MRVLLLLLALVFQQAPQTGGSIRVIARVLPTEAPAADVEVTVLIRGVPRTTPAVGTAKTNAAGVALFENLPAGDYFIQAQRQGFVGAARLPAASGLSAMAVGAVKLSSSDTQELTLSFISSGSINGRTLDAQSTPIANANVSLLTTRYSYANRTLRVEQSTVSDDAGRYSLKDIPDGDYYVRVQSPGNTFDVYYPSVLDAERAAPVAMRNGNEMQGIDIATPSLRTFKISGTVVHSPGPITAFSLSPTGGLKAPTDFASVPNRLTGSTEKFEIRGVPSGSWNLFPIVPLKGTSADPIQAISRPYATGRTRVEVVDHDLENIVIVMESTTLQAHVHLKGGKTDPAEDLRGVVVSLYEQDNIPGTLLGGSSITQTPEDDGDLLFPYMPPGTYCISINVRFSGRYISDVRLGNRSILDQGRITLGGDPVGSLEIDLSSGGGTIKGTLDDRETVSSALIALVPASQYQRESLLFYKTTTLSGNSREFTFRDVAPGNYKVIAWKNPPPGDPGKNAEFVARYESRGVSVSVNPDETKTIRVPLISDPN
jgi:hypothetical protein